MPRTLGINATPLVRAQRGARLRETRLRFPPLDGQAEGDQPRRVIVGLQFDIAEQRAVAAQAAGEAQLFRHRGAGHHGKFGITARI